MRAASPRCQFLPDRFGLDVMHAAQENRRVLVLEHGQRPADGILRPALRIGLDGILEETVEGEERRGKELIARGFCVELANQVSCLGDDEVVAILECLAQRCRAVFQRQASQPVEDGNLFFEAALPGHSRECNQERLGNFVIL